MDNTTRWLRTGRTVALWAFTVLVALGIGVAGLSKLHRPNRWEPLFAGWGYPAWFSMAVGVAEVCGAIALFVPDVAVYAATLLAAVMAGALVTLLRHPGGPFGWGVTPAVYIVLLTIIAAVRSRQRRPSPRRGQ
jgi:putative oxidoreductase